MLVPLQASQAARPGMAARPLVMPVCCPVAACHVSHRLCCLLHRLLATAILVIPGAGGGEAGGLSAGLLHGGGGGRAEQHPYLDSSSVAATHGTHAPSHAHSIVAATHGTHAPSTEET